MLAPLPSMSIMHQFTVKKQTPNPTQTSSSPHHLPFDSSPHPFDLEKLHLDSLNASEMGQGAV
ncbi:hypothetical protein L195_g009536 [Trifolium pratense]|uniref:Uncharacterized protein n=1 Tax=Trifolium pratense TaxID=57577 RepID=A0A2K3PC77_TRIPR|nr:hypothetical protein L195_g009536 [Trifolium pratense]